MAAEVRQFLSGRKGLTGAVRQARGLLLLPPALDTAISKFLEEYSSNELKKNVSRLSFDLRGLKDPVIAKDEPASEFKFGGVDAGGSEEARVALDDFLSSRPTRRKRVKGDLADAQEKMKYTDLNTAAYVAARMPAIYGAVHRVLSEVSRRVPDFKPSKLLDFGSGPGTALWATNEVWPGLVKKVNVVEPSEPMAHACRSLMKDVQNWPVIKSHPSLLDLTRGNRRSPREHDLVIASYTLGELPTMDDRISVARQLWSYTGDILVLIEPGTPHGSAIIREIRSHILQMERKKVRRQKELESKSPSGKESPSKVQALATTAAPVKKAGAFVIAPCSHEGRCPMEGLSTWCHFVQRLQRTSLQRITKRSSALPLRAYEDEKFSFIILRRGLRPSEPWPLDGLKDTDLPLESKEPMEILEYSASDFSFEGTDVDESSDEDEEVSEENVESEHIETGPKLEADLGSGWARIVRPPLRRGRHVILDVCRSTERDGSRGDLSRLVWTRKGVLARHLKAKKLRWGDLWPC
ncbi:hypothetical protein MPTK1_2g05200 [Marchantia polymorpha subsp. ruderalis]|uniref:Methyltransferase-like protein 17, mitochondrial n=1 Tax=Marchantia polymorpha TaxID=3197 RepID=A0A2R6X7Y7_MARPO|nr:hypothetical protein MARPO_0031s0174 [Marchantia polymorpha]BBN01161.1 hypothetical protein Mp_2g05200 [Marchantia polymorpha subsp. ruderalis]|eukprot:PTQ42212.1 hypothetical protein MARPO_0031s0174 [Marchantia polymorpha]